MKRQAADSSQNSSFPFKFSKPREEEAKEAEEEEGDEADEGEDVESDLASAHLQSLLRGEGKEGEKVEVHGQTMVAQIFSSDPPLLALHNFCSVKEAEAIVRTAEEKLAFRRSEVGLGVHNMRTSESAEVQPTDSPELLEVCRRIMSFSDQPNTIVQLVVVRYQPGQQFHLHHDGEFRRYTFLLYLNQPEEEVAEDISSANIASLPLTSSSSSSSSSCSSSSNQMLSSPSSPSSASSSPSAPSSSAAFSVPSSSSYSSTPSLSVPNSSLPSSPPSSLTSPNVTLSIKQGSGYLSRDQALFDENALPSGTFHGETQFPELKVQIRPKTGTAVVWRNNTTEPDGTVSADLRMVHAGLAPSKGTKYVLNCWILEESSLVD